MSRAIFGILFLALLSLQGAQKWKYQYRFELKKDQTAKVLISFRDKNVHLRDGVFTLRWTLYKNRALTLFSSYQKVESQHILYKGYRLGSFEVELIPVGSSLIDRVYLLTVFSGFDEKRGVANLDVYIKDDDLKILADFIDPNKKGKNAK